MGTRTVLLVEEDEDMRSLLTLMLEGADRKVAVAGEVHQAFFLLNHHRPDAVLVDVREAGEPCLELLRDLWMLAQYAGVPLVLLAADGDCLREAEKVGAMARLRRPQNFERLLDTLEFVPTPDAEERLWKAFKMLLAEPREETPFTDEKTGKGEQSVLF